jgi:hypothetical protein
LYTPASFRESSYIGWVAWVGGRPLVLPDGTFGGWVDTTPLLEAVPHDARLAQVIAAADERGSRGSARNVIDWKSVPHPDVHVLELYAFRDVYDAQPLVKITAPPDGHDIRWIQFKRRSIVAETAVARRTRERSGPSSGQSRTGISSWVMGYWDRTVGQAQYWDYPARGGKIEAFEYSGRNHPCWPRPLGFGLAPAVLGLRPEQVYPLPPAWAGARA